MMGVDFFIEDLKRNVSEFIDLQDSESEQNEYFTDGENLYSQAKIRDAEGNSELPSAAAAARNSHRTDSQDSLYGSDSERDETGSSFKVNFDCHQFPPDQLDVKLNGNYIVVSYITGNGQQLIRRCPVSDDIDPDSITTYMDPNGILTVKAERKGTNIPVHIPFSQPFPIDDTSDGYMSA